MRWKDTINDVLRRTTGYALVRSEHSPVRAKRKQVRTRPDYEAREIIRCVRPWTMTSSDKLFALIVATRYVAANAIPGAIAECGVWRGGSMQAVARTLSARGVDDRELHLFDTFEGMPPPTERDCTRRGRHASDLLTARPTAGKVWAVASLEDVQDGMAATGYPTERVRYHVGLVEQTIPEQAPGLIALLRLDTDWYASTRHELECLYERVAPGGVLIFDDYDYWQGARDAIDEFLDRARARLLLAPMGSGRIALKP